MITSSIHGEAVSLEAARESVAGCVDGAAGIHVVEREGIDTVQNVLAAQNGAGVNNNTR